MDHVVPGVPVFVLSCWRCNLHKGSRSADEWGPEYGARAREALARPLCIAIGRAMARELYPRPVKRAPASVSACIDDAPS